MIDKNNENLSKKITVQKLEQNRISDKAKNSAKTLMWGSKFPRKERSFAKLQPKEEEIRPRKKLFKTYKWKMAIWVKQWPT